MAYLAPIATEADPHQPAAGNPFRLQSDVEGSDVTIYRSKDNLTQAERKLTEGTSAGAGGLSVGTQGNLVTFNLEAGKSTILEKNARFGGNDIAVLSSDRKSLAYILSRGATGANTLETLHDFIWLPLDDPQGRRVVAEKVSQSVFGNGLTWSPNGRYLAWFAGTYDGVWDLYVYDTQSKKRRRLTPAVSSQDLYPHLNTFPPADAAEAAPVWLNERTIVARVHRGPVDAGYVSRTPTELWSIDVVSGQAKQVARVSDGRIRSILTRSPPSRALLHGGELIVRVQQDDHDDVLMGVDLESGSSREITGGHYSLHNNGSTPIPTASPDGQSALIVKQSATEPPEAWLQSLDGGEPRQLTHLNPALASGHWGRSQLLTYSGAHGKSLRAALLLPPGFKDGHPVPLIVNVYPVIDHSAAVNEFAFGGAAATNNAFLLTSRGYAVLFPDVRIESEDKRMQQIAEDVLAGTDEAIRRGFADPERLGITGISQGGYAVYALIVQTHRFKAAIPRADYSAWVPVYLYMMPDGTAPGIAFVESVPGVGSLWESRDWYIENSPLYFFDKVTTPTLIVHGTEDYLSDFNAQMAFVALRRLGKDVAYASYEGGNHGEDTFSIPNQRDYIERMLAWFDRYLCPDRVSVTSCTGS